MKNSFFSFIFFMLLVSVCFISCSKVNQVHFHGSIISYCGVPITNLTVFIVRDYDKNGSETFTTHSAVTDKNGYYSFINDVPQEGYFKSYTLVTTNWTPSSPNGYCCYQFSTTNNGTDVQIDGTIDSGANYSFHIKNVAPHDSNDCLNYISVGSDTIAKNIKGTMVDTILAFNSSHLSFYFDYSFIKNGITTNLQDTTNGKCSGVNTVDVFY